MRTAFKEIGYLQMPSRLREPMDPFYDLLPSRRTALRVLSDSFAIRKHKVAHLFHRAFRHSRSHGNHLNG